MSSGLGHRLSVIAGSITSTATLILLPKCPMCLAMDVALLTGASISATSAANVHTGIEVICAAALVTLALLALRKVKRARRSRSTTPGPL